VKTDQDRLFEQLFERLRGPLYAHLCRLIGDRERAEELLQDVFLRAYRALPKLPPEANHRAWLYRIASNAARDHHRRQRLRAWLPLPDDEHSSAARSAPDGSALSSGASPDLEEAIAVQAALQTLKPIYREPLILYSIEGLSVAEVAEVLGIGLSAAKMRLARARALFRQAYTAE